MREAESPENLQRLSIQGLESLRKHSRVESEETSDETESPIEEWEPDWLKSIPTKRTQDETDSPSFGRRRSSSMEIVGGFLTFIVT